MRWIDRFSPIVAVLGVLVFCSSICRTQTTAQYSVAEWGHKDGLPSTFVYSIAQTKDGFLWLGTEDGLVRFDGVQFTRWRPSLPDGQLLGQVRVLDVTRDGDLLLGTGMGLTARMRNRDLQVTRVHATVESMRESRDGSLWVATPTALWHLAATLQPIERPIALPGKWLSGPVESSDGREWITTQAGVFYVEAGHLVQFSERWGWLVMQDGQPLWLNQEGYLQSLPDEKIVGGSNAIRPYSSTITHLMKDSKGCLWIGTRGNGLVHFSTASGGEIVQRYTRSDGLSSDFVRSVFEDSEQNLWVATENGLNRLRRNKVLSLTQRNGLLSDTVTSIAAGNDGSVWLATPDGLQRLVQGQTTIYRRGVRTFSLLMSQDQQLWAGTTAGLLHWKDGHEVSVKRDARFTDVTTLAQDGSGALWFFDANKGLFRQSPGHDPVEVSNPAFLNQIVTAMARGQGGAVWFGLANGSIVEEHGGEFHTYSVRDGLSGGAIHGLSIGPDGELWGATGRGLCFLTGARFVCRNSSSGLPGNRVLWALPDTRGNLWLGYTFGVVRADARQLRSLSEDNASKLNFQVFDTADGIVNSPDLGGNAPAALAQDQRLWLTASQGVAVLDPEHIHLNLIPPPVSILGLQADGQPIDITSPIRLRPLTRSIEFSFTGLSLTVPTKVRFRYRLDGFDSDWHDGGLTREASFTNLPPGQYTFHVCAANSDGVWNTSGAALSFILPPTYYQTIWFRLLCVTAVILIAAVLFRLRLRSAQRIMRLRFEERMEERTRIAQELHDHLIQDMVGISMQLEVADELTAPGTNAKNPLQRALALCHSAIASGRLTLQSLRSRPVTASSLVDSLRRTAGSYPEKKQTAVEYRIEGQERLLQPEIAEDLSELGQEALRNALKHAGSGEIHVRLHYRSSGVELVVQDQGAGISDAVLRRGIPGHFGLAGMRERATRMTAEFSIVSASGGGTMVHVSIPAARAYQDDRVSADHSRSPSRKEPQEKAR